MQLQQKREKEGDLGAKPDGHGLPGLDPYLGSLLCCQCLIQKRGRVWLEKIVYVWRRRGRHGADESHSERRSVHMKRRRETVAVGDWKIKSWSWSRGGGGGMCLSAIVPFLLLPVTSASLSVVCSLARCGSVT